ncbi:MAG: geranyl transferase [Gammaproteobacteria bacterium]|nr:MAG: geranyl transferase [Gammaproteobacteria bacterium]
MTFKTQFTIWQDRINLLLESHLDYNNPNLDKLQQAMIYATKNGGKRFRPILIYACASAFDIDLYRLDNIAVSIELIHTYSLIHDDLPAMDNDDLRRGAPTTHKKFDEATAILSGDAMQALAFEILFNQKKEQLQYMEAGLILSRAAGINGMAGGQSLDLEATGANLSLSSLTNIHNKKTGKLIEACCAIPCIFAENLTCHQKKQILNFANKLGLLFQITDDILDITTDSATLGKTANSDLKENKATFPAIMGLDEAIKYADKIHEEARATLQDFDKSYNILLECADYVLYRKF